MVKFLVGRPVAVLVSFSVLVVFGLLALLKLPVSLLPPIDVPRIVVKVSYPNTGAAVIEESILKPLRENLSTLKDLQDMESVSSNHAGTLYLTFAYGARMDLTYIEVNERLDRLTNVLPEGLARPLVVRVNTSDIPIVRVQITPKNAADYANVSTLTEKVIKKRFEQQQGVSLVDLNGTQNSVITVDADRGKLQAYGITDAEVISAIQRSNRDVASLSVRDGHYRYFVKVVNKLDDVESIARLPVRIGAGTIVPIRDVARVTQELEQPSGFHLFNGREGLVLTIHKQESARMNDLVLTIDEVLRQLRKDYPDVGFSVTQDQTFVLDAGISNLNQDLVYGGILCVVLLFMFLGNYASPILMSVSIPVSLLMTFIFFYMFDISLNIISLSGLALGIGMLIDNSIIVIDSITRKRKGGLSMEDSCVQGTNEVIVPVISQVLTTVAVYGPLIYLSGLAGALVFDQAIALTISLSVSLVMAFCLNPVLYKLFLKTPPEKLRDDTVLFTKISHGYHRMIGYVFKRRRAFFFATLAMMPVGVLLGYLVPITALPEITQTETVVNIDWNEPIDVHENRRRVEALGQALQGTSGWEADIGIDQFLMTVDSRTVQQASVYFRNTTGDENAQYNQRVQQWLGQHYPRALFTIDEAQNSFTQLFHDNAPYFESRFRLPAGCENGCPEARAMEEMLRNLPLAKAGLGFVTEKNIELMIDSRKLLLYDVSPEAVKEQLTQLFGSYTITEIKRFGDMKKILLKPDTKSISEALGTEVRNRTGVYYPLRAMVSFSHGLSNKYITADRAGVYRSVSWDGDEERFEDIQDGVEEGARSAGIFVDFSGRYFNNSRMVTDIMVIVAISLVLLYFILAVQFEDLVQPVLVMLTIPLGVAGSMLLLYAAGGTINVMTAIGFVVVLGIIVDDPILKVETINRLMKEYRHLNLSRDAILEKALHDAGDMCLKPLLMTSLTTSLALVPILFTTDIGSELQRPLVLVIVGGLSLGTLLTLWFVPLAYWFVAKKRIDRNGRGDVTRSV